MLLSVGSFEALGHQSSVLRIVGCLSFYGVAYEAETLNPKPLNPEGFISASGSS